MPNRFDNMHKKKRRGGPRRKPQSLGQKKKELAQRESNTLGRWLSKDAKPLALSGTVDTQAGSGIPTFVKTKQVYFERVLVGDAVLSPASHAWRLNSTFDPNFTGGGSQPKGRDVMAGIYNSYTVTGCKYNIQFVSNTAVKTLVGALVTTDASISTTFDTMKEIMETKSPYCKKRMLYASNDSVKQEKVSITGYVPMSKFAHQTQGSLSDQFTAGVGANPTINVLAHVWAINEDGSAVASGGVTVRMFLTYYVLYHGVVVATSS